VSDSINIVARRIFNKLSEDIGDRRGIGDEWDQISPNVKSVEIRRTWEQIFIEEIEQHTAELQARVKRLEEAGDAMTFWCADEVSLEQWNNAKQ
jgi:ubiquinone biosynthesis protein UbiJ